MTKYRRQTFQLDSADTEKRHFAWASAFVLVLNDMSDCGMTFSPTSRIEFSEEDNGATWQGTINIET